MGYFGFALYIDMSPQEESQKKPAYVLFAEAVVDTSKKDIGIKAGVEFTGSAAIKQRITLDEGIGMLRGFYVEKGDLPLHRMRLFYWEIFEGATGVASRPLVNKQKSDEELVQFQNKPNESQCVLLTNYHYFIEKKQEITEKFKVWLVFDRDVLRVQERFIMPKESPMKDYDKDQLGVHQSKLGSITGWIPREYFYLRGESCFTQDWVESRWRVFLNVKDGEDKTHHQISALISALTLHVNFWVGYVHDAFKIGGAPYDFELFSNRTMLTQSGDCEDVAAWLMSAIHRVKVNNWCDGCMDGHLAINVLLKVDSGTVEGHKAGLFGEGGVIKSRETLSRERDGNFHVTCLVVNEEYVEALANGKDCRQTDVFLAEGTALVYSVFTKHVPGLDDHKALRKVISQKHLKNIMAFAGVGDAYDGAKDIYHTVVEIMINPEMEHFLQSKFESTVYLTCYEKDDKEFYPVTFADFVDPASSRDRVFLKSVMKIGQEDIDIYDQMMFFEPPRICFDGKVEKFSGEFGLGGVGFVTSDEDEEATGFDMGNLFKIIQS